MLGRVIAVLALIGLAGCDTQGSDDKFNQIPYSPAPFSANGPSVVQAPVSEPAPVVSAPLQQPAEAAPPADAPPPAQAMSAPQPLNNPPQESAPPPEPAPYVPQSPTYAPPPPEPMQYAPQPQPMPAPPPQNATPPSEHCHAVARQRSQDAAMNGLSEEDQQHVFDGTYADCAAYEAKHGPG